MDSSTKSLTRPILILLGLVVWLELNVTGFTCDELYIRNVGPKIEQTESAALTLEDKQQIQELLRIKNRIGAYIWPDFEEPEIPLVLYNRDYEFLMFHPAPPAEWTKVEDDTIQGLPYFRKKAVNSEAFTVQIGSLWAGSLDTLSFMNVSLEKQVYERIEPEKITPALLAMMKFTPAQHVVVLMHEVFHAYQATHYPDRFRDALGMYNLEQDYPYTNQAFKETWNREGQYLLEGLREKENLKARVSVEDFLGVRSQRRKDHQMDRAFISFEQELEWLEGLAKYAEMCSAELGSEEQFSKNFKEYRVARGRLRADFYYRLRNLGEQKGDLRFYLSGAAQALLLDRLLPEWKTEFHENNRVTLEDLLMLK